MDNAVHQSDYKLPVWSWDERGEVSVKVTLHKLVGPSPKASTAQLWLLRAPCPALSKPFCPASCSKQGWLRAALVQEQKAIHCSNYTHNKEEEGFYSSKVQNKGRELNLKVKPSPVNKKGRYRAGRDPKFPLSVSCSALLFTRSTERFPPGLTAWLLGPPQNISPVLYEPPGTELTPHWQKRKLHHNQCKSNLPLFTLIQWSHGNFPDLQMAAACKSPSPCSSPPFPVGNHTQSIAGAKEQQVKQALRCDASHTGGRLGAPFNPPLQLRCWAQDTRRQQ